MPLGHPGRPLPDHAADPPLRGTGARPGTRRRHRRRHPPVHRPGGRRGRGAAPRCAPDDRDHQHPPRPRPRAGQGRRRRAGMLAELPAGTTGLNRGRGGSMHAADLSLGIFGANGIVGAGAPIAAGAAWARPGDGRGPGGGDLLRRRRPQPGRAAGVDQPRRALAAAGAVRVREQRVRDHAVQPRTAIAGSVAGRAAALRHPGRSRWTAWTCEAVLDGGRSGGRTGPAPAAARRFLECRPTGSRATTRSSARSASATAPPRRSTAGGARPAGAGGRGSRQPTGSASTPRSSRLLERRGAVRARQPGTRTRSTRCDYLLRRRACVPGKGSA